MYEVEQTDGSWISDDVIMKVHDGAFSSHLAKVPAGELDAWVAFDVGAAASEGVHQPPAVIARYGKRGQLITNAKKQYDGSRRVEATARVK